MLNKLLVQLFRCNIKAAALLSLVYCLLFNSSIILFKFDYYKADLAFGVLELLKDFIQIFIANFIIFLGLSLTRPLFIVGSLFLFFTGAISSYSIFFFKIFPTKQIIRALFENEVSESVEILSVRVVIWVIFALLISLRLSIKTKTKQSIILPSICLVIFISNIIMPQYKVLRSYFPIQYLHNSYLYYLDKFHSPEKKDISQEVDFTIFSDDDIIGIIVVGEAARYDHFSLNGYERETTPLLAKIPNLVSFEAEAHANLTYLSVPYMFSNLPRDKISEAIYETSVLSILTKLGIETSWVGSQSLLKYLQGYTKDNIYHEVNMAIIPGGSALYQMNALDEVMLPYFDKIIEMKGKKFVVLHTSGSHWNYSARYPKEFEHFKPVCASEVKMDHTVCSKDELVNIYDNSVLYTDYILDQVIERLKGRNAFLIYVSDHGESLGEEGRYTHGAQPMPKEQTSIPFIFWGSDKFLSQHPALLENLKASRNQILNHNYIFHSSLGCMGIESNIINQGLNLCKTK
jgi:glucan phosphoethanolaminetransferase (alkaline phosphatase superfamily)